ncbi:hypothetical protein [Paenibacillus wynnii]|uniref:Uncharacterized protein n=1 Tax=Paenibacillus wynnii TaxID=268407 RepID=A0A098M972_9BACL|nr:hypothetical protein [Paenibacillus wynnii]KGE19094.1 hypothetical protein PWYN_06855 [Paenibacillus wynnii]
MKRKIITILSAIILITSAYYTGYQRGSHSNSSEAEPIPVTSLYSKWVVSEKPPLPVILIDGQDIRVYRGTYSWSQLSGNGGSINAVSVDAASAPPMMKSTVVAAGSKIENHAPPRVKEFNMSNITEGFEGDLNSYSAPASKGVYTYRIHCEWFLDQGHADYFFSIQVK